MIPKGSMVDWHLTESHRDYARLPDLTDALLLCMVSCMYFYVTASNGCDLRVPMITATVGN